MTNTQKLDLKLDSKLVKKETPFRALFPEHYPFIFEVESILGKELSSSLEVKNVPILEGIELEEVEFIKGEDT